jgi:hypothetical protein
MTGLTGVVIYVIYDNLASFMTGKVERCCAPQRRPGWNTTRTFYKDNATYGVRLLYSGVYEIYF